VASGILARQPLWVLALTGAAVSMNVGDGARPFAALEAEFQRACDAAVAACRTLSPPYHPSVWIGMVAKLGAAEAARRLVISGDIQTGFGRLVQAGRPELTIEWAICDPTWTVLFSEQHRETARWRLRQAGVEPPA
jgi:hypothetical protein